VSSNRAGFIPGIGGETWNAMRAVELDGTAFFSVIAA
jgi:hypothetical protein